MCLPNNNIKEIKNQSSDFTVELIRVWMIKTDIILNKFIYIFLNIYIKYFLYVYI